MNCCASHVKTFGNNGDSSPSHAIFHLQRLQHQNHLDPLIFQYLPLPCLWRKRVLLSEASPSSMVSSNQCSESYLFCEPLLLIISHQEMTIKHSNYIQLCPFMYTKVACVVFCSFKILLGRFFMRSEV